MNKYSSLITTLIILLFFSINSYSQIFEENTKWTKVADGLNFPEGPAFDGKGNLYLSNCYGAWITRYFNGSVDTFIAKSENPLSIEKTNGLAYWQNTLYVCEYGKGKILKIGSDGVIKVYAEGYNNERFNRPNDMTFDLKGNLFFTDPKSYDTNILDGRIFLVDVESKSVSLLADSLAFPNGINISPIDNRLYVCESAKQKIVSFKINPDLSLSDKRDFAEIPGGDPDGIEFDVEGNLYAAHFGGKAVFVFSPEGKLLEKIETPGKKPTNLEFGDENYQTLYLTEVETNSLYKIRTVIPGKNKVERTK